MNYYNEIDPFSAAWLRELIREAISPRERWMSATSGMCVQLDLVGFSQCHFFAGIGVWSYALRQAGWPDDRPVCAPAPVSRFPLRVKEEDSLTNDTCGLRSTSLLESARLTSSLANRLRQKTDLLGSTLFRLTWKERVTPSGRRIPALRASGRRTSGSDFTSWPTPNTPSG